MMLLWLDFLYLDGYDTLWDKYHDNSKITRAQHEWIVENKKEFEAYLFSNHLYKLLYRYRRAFHRNDWDTMLEIMVEQWEIDEDIVYNSKRSVDIL